MTVRRSDTRAPWRAALAHQTIRFFKGLGLALAVATAIQCSDAPSSTAPKIQVQKRATLSLQPSFSTLPAGLTIDLSKIRGVLVGAAGDSVVTEALFQGDSAILVFTVQFTGTTGTFKVDLTAYDKLGQVAFHGVDTVTVKPGDNPPVAPPPMQYAGPDAGVAKIKIVPNPVTLDAGSTAGLAVTGFTAAGQPVNAAVRATWISRAPSVASIDGNSGLVTAGPSEASTYVVATSATGAVDSALVQIHAPVATLTVAPNPAQVVRGDSLQLVAVMKDAAGHTITGRSILWTITDQTKATISATGMLRGKAFGSATVSALVEGKQADVPVTVVSPVDHIEATPSPIAFASLGEQQTLAVKIVPRNNASLTGVVTSIVMADPSVASMDTASRMVTALKNGSTTIIIKADLASLVVPVTVQQKARTLTVSPKSFSASARGQTQKFTAAILDSLGHAVVGAKPNWQSTNAAVVMIDTTGVASAVDNGTARIAASYTSLSDSATATVNRTPMRVAINVPKSTINVGETMVATASIVDANGYPMTSAITWTTSNRAVLTVDNGGGVRGVGYGTANLQAAAGAMSTGVTISVASTSGGVGGEILVANDINIDNYRVPTFTGLNVPNDNLTLYRNFVSYSPSGPRASATKVLMFHGHSSECAGNFTGQCGHANLSHVYDAITSTGLSIAVDTNYASTLTTVAPDIKVIWIWVPETAFSAAEITTLKQFLADGGRIFFIGENPGYYSSGRAIQNQFFFDMGSAVRMTGQYSACTYGTTIFIPATKIHSNPLTAGVQALLADCAAELSFGPNDVDLADDINGMTTFVLTRANSAPPANLAPSFNRRAGTAPAPVPPRSADGSASAAMPRKP